MKWNKITTDEELQKAIVASETKPIVIFKYSSRCSISDRVLENFEMEWDEDSNNAEEKIEPYFLDLIRHRSISNDIARRFHVIHESPQVLAIKNGKSVYAESHGYIRLEEILKSIKGS